MKKIFALALAVLLSVSQAVFIAAESPALPGFIKGTIVKEADKTIEIKPDNGEGNLILNLGDMPVIVDCASGQPAALKDRADDSVAAYYGPATTKSIPPQSNAIVVMLNVANNAMPPHYSKAESVERTADQVKVTADNGSLIVTINKDASIFPYLTRNIVTLDMIDVGSKLLMWYPMAASSYPAQATANKVLYLGVDENTPVTPAPVPGTVIKLQIGNTQATVNGKTVALDAPPIISNDRTMLPVRFIAENLNCNVDWDGDTKGVTITSGAIIINLQIGNTQATVNRTSVTLDAPPIISNDRTMLPVRFIAENLKCEVDWDANTKTVTITQ